MLITVEIVDIGRFSTPWKLVSYAGLAPSIRESSGKVKYRKITKQASPWVDSGLLNANQPFEHIFDKPHIITIA